MSFSICSPSLYSKAQRRSCITTPDHFRPSRSLNPGNPRSALKPSISRTLDLPKASASETETYRWPEWKESWSFLTDCDLQSVDPARAKDMVDSGKWVLVDARPKSFYDAAHPPGALSLPLFDNMDWSNASPKAYLRAAAYLFNGVAPVVPNESFEADLAEIKKEGKGLIFYCETGGTMAPSTNFMYGKESRSLKACYRVLSLDEKYPVSHLEGGIYAWFKNGLPMEGKYDEGNAGRTPNIAEEPEKM